MERVFVWVAALAILGFSQLSYGANISVTPGSDNDCSDNDCKLFNALSLAEGNNEGDTITIAAGEYHISPGGWNYQPVAGNFPLTIQGAGIGSTILDGIPPNPGEDIQTPLSISTTSLPSDTNAHISISGITFRNGIALVEGGGLRIETIDADITVTECAFEENETTKSGGNQWGGGGLFAGAQNDATVTVTDSLFINNSANDANGGGLFATNFGPSPILISGNIFMGNNAGDMDGTDQLAGGGAYALSPFGSVMVDQNLALENFAEGAGGGLFLGCFDGNCKLRNNIAARNSNLGASTPDTPGGGGGVFVNVVQGTLSVINNTITANQDQGSGGGLFASAIFDSATLNIYNNIIWGNTAVGANFCGAGNCDDLAIYDLDHDNNGSGSVLNVVNNDYVDVFVSCVSGVACTPNLNSSGNKIDVDPLFVNAGNDDYHLSGGSSLIDMGSGTAPDLPLTDFDDNDRIMGPAPDLGAYEFGGDGPANCDRILHCLHHNCKEAEICELPEFEFPNFEFPEVELPGFELPEVELPEVEVPEEIGEALEGLGQLDCNPNGGGDGSPASASMLFISLPVLVGLRRWRGRNKK